MNSFWIFTLFQYNLVSTQNSLIIHCEKWWWKLSDVDDADETRDHLMRVNLLIFLQTNILPINFGLDCSSSTERRDSSSRGWHWLTFGQNWNSFNFACINLISLVNFIQWFHCGCHGKFTANCRRDGRCSMEMKVI